MLTDIYYLLKPILPWRLRIALRRWRGQRRREASAAVWPIDPVAAAVPTGWPGWPEGKQFALILTHDVEGKKGFDRIPQLMEISKKYGFRSSFYFVPKGEYRVDRGMRDRLNDAGFELGLHGLEHDGKLYRSKKEFVATAAEIRKTLHEFGACGFRSPLMQHKLGWIHELGSEYDASTFDVDPFEPQPDGMTTIFPFWVSSGENTGYVELPYTIVQDFTLFIVLGEKNNDIWKKKLDWVAEHGGMALINTHPDYMCFGGEPARDEYPVSHYEEFLRYAREKYGDTFWHALPREVSRYYCDMAPIEKRNTRRKVCMVAYSYYIYDNRVRRYAETLARRGDIVDVIALSLGPAEEAEIELNGVKIYNAFRREQNESNPWTYALRHLRFMVKASSLLCKLHKEKNYDVIHVHNIPDFLVFAAWYPKFTGAKLILDIHDIVPELFENKFRSGIKKLYVSVLRILEKLSIKFVDHVIVSNHLWFDKLIARSADENHCSVLVNHVDQEIFSRRTRTRNDGKYIVIFPGSFQWHQGLDIGIRAFSQFRKKVTNAEFHLYGGGNEQLTAVLKALVRELDLDDSVKFLPGVSLDEIAQVIANADLGVVPKRADSFGNEAYSTKIMEFMSQGVPVVVSRTKIDSYYFKEDEVRFFASGDVDSMTQAMCDVAENKDLRDTLIENGLEYVEKNSWTRKRAEYLRLIDDLATEHFWDIQPDPGLKSVSEL